MYKRTHRLSLWFLITISILVVTMIPARIDAFWKSQNTLFVILLLYALFNYAGLKYKYASLLGPGLIITLLIIELATSLMLQFSFAMNIITRTLLKQIRDPLAGILAYFLISGLAETRDWSKIICLVIHVFTISMAIILILSYIPLFSWIVPLIYNRGRVGFTLGFEGPNSFGAAIALLLPWSVALIFDTKELGQKLVYILYSCILLVGITLTGSRGAFLSLIIGFAILSCCFIIIPSKKRLTFVLSIGLMFVVTLILSKVITPSPFQRLLGTNWLSLATDLTTSRRLSLIQGAIDLIIKRPIFGYGFGGYEEGLKNVISYEGASSLTPHNSILFIAVQAGILGVCLLLSFYVLLLTICLKLFREKRNHFTVASLAFAIILLVNELFFPYLFTHDVGLIVWIINSAILLGYYNQYYIKRVFSHEQKL